MGAQHHQWAQPDVGIELERHDRDHGNGEQDVCRKRRQELRDRLHPLRRPWPEPNPDADRHPDQAGDGNQHHHPDEGQKAEPERAEDVAHSEVGVNVIEHEPQREAGPRQHDREPDDVPRSFEPRADPGDPRQRDRKRRKRQAHRQPIERDEDELDHAPASHQIVDP